MAITAIDYTPACEQGGGIGRLVRELVAALARTDTQTPYRLFVAGATAARLPAPPGANFTFTPTRLTPAWLARLWHRAQVPLPVTVFTGPVNLYHATDFVLPPVPRGVKTLLTVHDLSFVRVPAAASPALKAYLERVVPQSIRRAHHVIADSQATRADIMALYGTPADKITVLLSGVDARFRPAAAAAVQAVREKYHLGTRPYLFCVGTVQPRKNYSRVIQALAALRRAGHDLALVIAGGRGWLEDEMYQTLAATGMGAFVHLIGFVDDADLPALYTGAACVAFPSLYEGFGFPILEGMACGTPVVTAAISSLPEVAGEAALLVDPLDTAALTAALERALTDADLRQTLIQRGFERVQQFTWAAAARHLQTIYQQALAL
ncbi:MAG: glycosyltransferase family 4 protein [Anaerolineae bacterium]|nr:glycosyltransferase family 4 protein [Anaerolineae bacterium]